MKRPKLRPAMGRIVRHSFTWGTLAGIVLVILVRGANSATSADSFCASCHIHPQATISWQQSTHHTTKSGMVIGCVECHLPPGGIDYGYQKARTGIRDVWGKLFKDPDSFDWDERSRLEHARRYVFRESCLKCHTNLFPIQLTDKGAEAHLYYDQRPDQLRCISCHLHVGHFDPDATKATDFGVTVAAVEAEIYDAPAVVEGFVDYSEFVPGTSVSFDMVAVPGGAFQMGSPADEPYRGEDEGPVHAVEMSPFWMGRVEVTWDEFQAWYAATRAEGRTDTRAAAGGPEGQEVDAFTGATPPYVPPDQGWGKGDRPAITMTHHAAVQYTRWLSEVTGKRYRLPTEAEWEYAARAGTQTPYFFEGTPKKYTTRRTWNKIFGRDTEVLDLHAIHEGNSDARTQSPADMEPNPFGLVNMLGNVREFTQDWYDADAYATRAGQGTVEDPRGPESGTEYVVRGGSFRSDPADLRAAARDRTRTDAWLLTDPQIPKSLWWYSDVTDVGFRVVRELDEEEQTEGEAPSTGEAEG
jgi:formylglycine-generating enzyme required for sulfatase activity/nitrate/TMAO reductase-like tetraheme cytochrome c subunit